MSAEGGSPLGRAIIESVRSHTVQVWTLLLALCILAVVPFALVRFPPINDYPFHLARIVILAHLDNPVFARFYTHGSFLLPNVALDAFALPLARVLGAEGAVRLFVELSLVLILVGTLVLNRVAHGRTSAWPLLGAALLYNGIFRFGFFNYLFGVGLALCAIALWMSMRKGVARSIAAFAGSIILIFCHMSAFGVFALAVAGVELDRAAVEYRRNASWVPIANLILSAIPFVSAFLLFAAFSPTAGVANTLHYAPGWLTKPVSALFSLSSGIMWLDAATSVSVLLLAAWIYFKGWLSVSRPLVISVILLGVALYALPPTLMGSLYADARLGPAIAFVAIAALNIRSTAPNLVHVVVGGVAFVLVAAHTIALSLTWSSYDRDIQSIVRAMDVVPADSTLFAYTADAYPRLISDSRERQAVWRPPLKHVASYAVLHAPIFVPMTFADPTKQPLVVAPAFEAVRDFQGDNPILVGDQGALATALETLHQNLKRGSWPRLSPVYALVMGRKRLEPMHLPSWSLRIAQGDRFVLLRID